MGCCASREEIETPLLGNPQRHNSRGPAFQQQQQRREAEAEELDEEEQARIAHFTAYFMDNFHQGDPTKPPTGAQLQAAAARGSAQAQAALGFATMQGLFGLRQNQQVAFSLYQQAAAQGLPLAMMLMASCLKHGLGVQKNPAESARLSMQAAEAGETREMFNIALDGQRAGDFALAVKWYERGAQGGSVDCMLNLGMLHEKGTGVPQSWERAVHYYRAAAQCEARGQRREAIARAAHNLANCYDKGWGVALDRSQAAHWLERAMECGDGDAALELGSRFEDGTGVEQSLEASFACYAKGMQLHQPSCVFNVANCLRNGWGCPVNLELAEKLYGVAAALGVSQGHMEMMKMQMMRSLGVVPTPTPHPSKQVSDETKALLAQAEATTQDREARAALLQRAADGHSAVAMAKYAVCLANGDGVAQNTGAAVSMMRLAAKNDMNAVRFLADEGDPLAQFTMGGANLCGDGVLENHESAVKWFRGAAEQGYAPALHALGLCLQSGSGVPQDMAEAARVFRLAADQGMAPSQISLGLLLEAGATGVPADMAEAVRQYERAAAQGDAEGLLCLGNCHAAGNGVPQSNSEALRLIRASADKEHAKAQNIMGGIYLQGDLGVAVDAAEAVKFFRLAADQGHSDAQYNLGVCYLNGRGVAVDQAEAVRLWQLAADSGNESAARALLILTQGAPGTVIITEDDNEEEEEEQEEGEEIDLVALRLKAGAGDSNAQVLLGQCYEHGWAGVEINMVEASKLYLMAGMQGNPRAQLVLAMSYAGNTSTERDAAQMIRWYRMAADQGLADAQSNLGEHYHYGIDVPVDVAEAARLYRAAAAQDFGYAQLNLAVCLRKGQGVAVDLAEAKRLADTAVAAGFDVVDIDRGEMVITFANGQGNSLHNAEHLIDWCRMYADRGNAEAQCVLGHCFRAGHGVPPDAAEAVRLYTLAADQGDGIGRLSLATCLAEGAGVPAADKAAAQRLYALATADGWELTGLEQMEGSSQRFKASFANEADHMFESREEATRFCRLAADNGNTAAKQALAECLAQAEE